MISRQYASQLEFQGDYPAALDMYERGLNGIDVLMDDPVATPSEKDVNKHVAECKAGKPARKRETEEGEKAHSRLFSVFLFEYYFFLCRYPSSADDCGS